MSVGDNDLTARLVEQGAKALTAAGYCVGEMDFTDFPGREERVNKEHAKMVGIVLDSLGLLSRLQAAEKVVEAAEAHLNLHDGGNATSDEKFRSWERVREALAAWKEQV